MKKLLLFAVSAAFVGLINAQDCTPSIDAGATLPGLNPNPPVGSFQGVNYDEVNTLVIPGRVDNTLTPSPGDSIQLCAIGIVAVQNMPVGYNYDVWAYHSVSTPYDVLALPGTTDDTISILQTAPVTRACIRLKNPTPPGQSDNGDGMTDRDSVPITVIVQAYADLFGCSSLGASARDTFEINLCIHDITFNVEEQHSNLLKVENNYPNPAIDITTFNFTTPTADEVTINVYDAVGRNVHNFKGVSIAGKNQYGISTSEFQNGVYIYSITYGNKTISKKMIVNK